MYNVILGLVNFVDEITIVYFFKILVSIPIQSVNRDDVISNENIEDLTDESWNTWTKIRTFCEENTRLGLILGKLKLF